MPRTRTRTTWQKGYCPNPGGRPTKNRTIEELAREHTPAAIAALVAALENPRERVPAATELLNRAWGRPKQTIGGDENAPLFVDFTWAPASPLNGHSEIAPPVHEPLTMTIEAEPEDAQTTGQDTEALQIWKHHSGSTRDT
jgi:hypothetical protein